MNLLDFLKPVSSKVLDGIETLSPRSWLNKTAIHTQSMPDIENYPLWIVGVKEHRGSKVQGGANAAPDAIRRELYALICQQEELGLADLGNIEAGNELSDTMYALQQVVAEALRLKKILIIMGGSNDLAYAQYKAYEGSTRNLRLVSVDAHMQLGVEHNSAYLGNIILHEPNYLFNISHLGYQTYFCEEESLNTFSRMNFDAYRLGNLRKNMEDCEPLLRDADMCVFDISAIRHSDAPGQGDASPNGLFGDEACQVARYAGMSNELSTFGVYGCVPQNDIQWQTAKLMAQMIWYFADGVQNRKHDYPAAESNDFQTYRITFNNSEHEVVFYKSMKSDRWWMEVPYPAEKSSRKGSYLVPCAYRDYETACNDEVPDRWLKTFYKLI